jgi:hypothetical protein
MAPMIRLNLVAHPIRCLFVFACCLDVACGGSGKSGASCVGDTVCSDAYFCTGQALQVGWITAQIATGFCTESPPEGTELYSSCTVVSNSPTTCGLATGMQTCNGSWTSLCQHDTDCPDGTLCWSGSGVGDVPATLDPQFGTCEKTCTIAGNSQCGRCDRACDTAFGVCSLWVPNRPTNVPCDATHAALDITLAFEGGGQFSFGGHLDVTVPGTEPFQLEIRSTSISEGRGEVVVVYPLGATSGPASATFSGEGPGILHWTGTVDFTSDPTICTRLTVPVMEIGPPDAGM